MYSYQNERFYDELLSVLKDNNNKLVYAINNLTEAIKSTNKSADSINASIRQKVEDDYLRNRGDL